MTSNLHEEICMRLPGKTYNKCEAKLEDGTVTSYDIASTSKRKMRGYNYLGKGQVYKINDVLQTDNGRVLYFYSKAK